jgi:hypothetical protein
MRKPRKPIPRGQPPKRSKPIARSRTPIPARRKDPSKRRWASHRDGHYTAWIATLPCLLGLCWGEPIECAHVRARSTGGDDRDNCVPLCRSHHREQHSIGSKSFQEYYEVDLEASALAYGILYNAAFGRPAPDPGATA